MKVDLTVKPADRDRSKPKWNSHKWPQIVLHPSGRWYGVRAGWKMSIHNDFKEGDTFSLLSDDCEFLKYGDTCATNWRESLEQRPE